MLSGKEKEVAMKEGIIYCAKCDAEMAEKILPSYEYLEGWPLSNVPAYKCSKCWNIFFTEEQAAKMEKRTKRLLESTFGFERKVTVSGKSLALTIPQELARHLKLSQGTLVKITPLSKEGLIVRKIKS